jgi:hypothetical protein
VHAEQAQGAELGHDLRRHGTAGEPVRDLGQHPLRGEVADGVAQVALGVGEQFVDAEQIGPGEAGAGQRCGHGELLSVRRLRS